MSRPEPKKWINSVKDNSIKVDSTVTGVKYYEDNIYGENQMINPNHQSQYENNYISLGRYQHEKNGTNGLNKRYHCGHGVNDFRYHGGNPYQYGSNGVLVQLGTLETHVEAELDILGTVISLTRGEGRRDVKIKTNILEMTMQLDYSLVRLCIQCAINL